MKTIEERLLARVEFDTNGGCWLWGGAASTGGYGQMVVAGRVEYVHRLAWTVWRGPIPADKPEVCHRCDTRRCIRPDHLFAGTKADNMADMVRKDRHWEARLRAADIPVIRARLAAGERQASIARAFGVRRGVIYEIARGATWRP